MSIEAVGIRRVETKGCNCNNTAFVYYLPVPLDIEILSCISSIGTPSLSFEKTCLLRIETPDLIITGVRRLKEIRFTVKVLSGQTKMPAFEEGLIKYVESRKK